MSQQLTEQSPPPHRDPFNQSYMNNKLEESSIIISEIETSENTNKISSVEYGTVNLFNCQTAKEEDFNALEEYLTEW